jgi:CRP/FNR family cyclic AMP-dependent transcriptional regulator
MYELKSRIMKKILFIDDSDDIRSNTAEILELANYKVCTAENGKTGVEMALKERPDLVICDIMMPVLDGYGVLHALQKNSATMNTPFIFLTAKTEKSDLRKGMEAGADDYIMKPFTGTELLNAVEGRLKKTELLKLQFSHEATEISELNKVSGAHILRGLIEDRNINKYKKKQTIYFEGNRPGKLFYIQKGKVRTFKTNDDGKELVVELFNKGDFLGYAALLAGTSYKETAEAMEETELAIIPKEDFDELIHNNYEVAQTFIKLLARNVREKEEHLLGLAYNSLRRKVASALLQLDEKYNSDNNKDFTIAISRENLATIAGTATESLIRTLTDFKNEHLIELNHGSIVLRNKQKLQSMFN